METASPRTHKPKIVNESLGLCLIFDIIKLNLADINLSIYAVEIVLKSFMRKQKESFTHFRVTGKVLIFFSYSGPSGILGSDRKQNTA